MNKRPTIDIISGIFCNATKDVVSKSTNISVEFSPTIQKIPNIYLKPDIGCFVQFRGDYSGLMILNFHAKTAMRIYKSSMLRMGLPEKELATEHTSDEVVDSIGEMVNQIIGNARRKIEEIYGLSAVNNPPKAISIMETILLSITSAGTDNTLARRLSFKVESTLPFYIELSMEDTEFVSLLPNQKK